MLLFSLSILIGVISVVKMLHYIVLIVLAISPVVFPSPLNYGLNFNFDSFNPLISLQPIQLTIDNVIKSFQKNVNNTMLLVAYLRHQITKLNTDSGLSCEVCKLIFTFIKAITDTNMNEDQAIEIASNVCTLAGILQKNVCVGLMNEVGPVLLYVYKNIRHNKTIDNICGYIIDGNCIFTPYYLPQFDWKVFLPKVRQLPEDPSPYLIGGKSTLRILHISDTHFDDEYEEGSINNCEEVLCCRADSTLKPGNKVKVLAGKFGGLNGSCDIPFITLESMLKYATQNVKYDYVYWTGDIPAHDLWKQTKENNIEVIRSTYSIINQYFHQKGTVFATIGNHEANPINSYPGPTAYNEYNNSYLYDVLRDEWSKMLPNVNATTITKGAYYFYDVLPRLRVISINTNYGLRYNFFNLMENNDTTEQLQWLIEQLDYCESNGIKVHIISHVPPGWTAYVWARNYISILQRYRKTITGHFYGHTHYSMFEVIFNEKGDEPISVAHIGPSITTATDIQPAFRVYTVDTATWQVLDFEEHFLDINKANLKGVADWQLLYNAKTFYNMTDFSPRSFVNLVNRMKNDDQLFNTFYSNYLRRYGADTPRCDSACKSTVLCWLLTDWPGRNATCSGGKAQFF